MLLDVRPTNRQLVTRVPNTPDGGRVSNNPVSHTLPKVT